LEAVSILLIDKNTSAHWYRHSVRLRSAVGFRPPSGNLNIKLQLDSALVKLKLAGSSRFARCQKCVARYQQGNCRRGKPFRPLVCTLNFPTAVMNLKLYRIEEPSVEPAI
jgi:hypothetical protein